MDLKAEREELVERLAGEDRDAFPGSRAWKSMRAAENALAAFDAAHPEIAAEIRAAHAAAVEARTIPAGGR